MARSITCSMSPDRHRFGREGLVRYLVHQQCARHDTLRTVYLGGLRPARPELRRSTGVVREWKQPVIALVELEFRCWVGCSTGESFRLLSRVADISASTMMRARVEVRPVCPIEEDLSFGRIADEESTSVEQIPLIKATYTFLPVPGPRARKRTRGSLERCEAVPVATT